MKVKKGIMLAGGKGTRLFPLTKSISKQMLPVYDKPMICYPIKTLLDVGVENILIISASEKQQEDYMILFGNQIDHDGVTIKIEYVIQESPNGIAEAFIIGEKFIGDDDVVLILGDNVFLTDFNIGDLKINTIFVTKVKDPNRYGVAKFCDDGVLEELIEKPTEFVSEYAVTGVYILDNKCIEYAKTLKPSKRGELEILELISKYDSVHVHTLSDNEFWFDCGDIDELLKCSNMIKAIEDRTGKKLGYNINVY